MREGNLCVAEPGTIEYVQFNNDIMHYRERTSTFLNGVLLDVIRTIHA